MFSYRNLFVIDSIPNIPQFIHILDRFVGLGVSMSEVAGSIPGTSANFKCGLGLERGPPSY